MKIFIKPTGSLGNFTLLGECEAFMIEMKNGKKFYSGKPEAIFSLRQTEEDRHLLKDMKIG